MLKIPYFMLKVMFIHNLLYIEETPINGFKSCYPQPKSALFTGTFFFCVIFRVA